MDLIKIKFIFKQKLVNWTKIIVIFEYDIAKELIKHKRREPL